MAERPRDWLRGDRLRRGALARGSPLLLSGLWSDLASLRSRWDAAVGSGVGLVLQLFSCFTGDESAMELWLLLSSAEKRRPAVVQTCPETR